MTGTDQHPDIPAGHHAVEHPAARRTDRLGDGGCDDVEAVPYDVPPGANSRASDLV